MAYKCGANFSNFFMLLLKLISYKNKKISALTEKIIQLLHNRCNHQLLFFLFWELLVYFPMQMVLMLSEPEKDYDGGEFVLTQQIPRAQSKAIVLKPKKGDALIFTTNFKPEKGTRGYYRVNMKHGVSELRNGERYSLGIIFHDASS